MTSTRLPGKVLLPLAGKPSIVRLLERIERIEGLDGVCLALPEGAAHDPIAAAAAEHGFAHVPVVRGSEHDVLSRFARAVHATGAEAVMRITSDCPLIDPVVSGAVLAAFRASGVAYARTAPGGCPPGLDTGVVRAEALLAAAAEAVDPYDREHVMPFVRSRPGRFPALYLHFEPAHGGLRMTVDYPADYALARALYERLHPKNPQFGLSDILSLIAAEPELAAINADPEKSMPENPGAAP